jgi:oligopeptide/dipeptide ABC transporter ATP-binding protein
VLQVHGLTTWFGSDDAPVVAVDDVSLTVSRGKTLAIVGESGSGKSVLALSIMRLLQNAGRTVRGRVVLGGKDLSALGEEEMRSVRGRDIGIVFQEPSTSLNPLMTVGRQVAEAILEHEPSMKPREAMDRVVERFRLVGIPAPELRVHDYPHQLSGGMRQRVMIAMALACGPQLLIGDEPTTALDVTVQAQVLHLIDQLREAFGMAVVLITHDLAIVADYADTVVVMYAGRKVEEGSVEQVLERPAHPYTRALLECRPNVENALTGQRLVEIPGVVPPLDRLPPGCAFAGRCAQAREECTRSRPALELVGPDHRAACFLAERAQLQ